MRRHRLAIIVSHPIQYYAPWFRYLAQQQSLDIKVFYLWDFGVTAQWDRGFGQSIQWDIPMLDGYEHEFVPNVSGSPGTHHSRGLVNPDAETIIARWAPDSILMFGYRYWTHQRILKSRSLRSVSVLFRGDSHELVPRHSLRDRLARLVRRRIFRRFAAALAVGKANEVYLRDSGILPSNIFFAPHAVDNNRFSSGKEITNEATAFRDSLGIARDSFVYLFVGKLEEKKRPLDLLHAYARLKQQCVASCSLLYVGAGEQQEELCATANHLGVTDVHFAPFQNQSQMPRTYAAGNVLVLPSHGPGETWGLVVNEAMNLELPIIASSHVGCGPDLVLEEQNGWIFPAGDQAALADRLANALLLPDRCHRFGRRSKELVAQYDYQATTLGLLKAIEYLH